MPDYDSVDALFGPQKKQGARMPVVAMTAGEKASDEAFERSPAALAALQQEIARQSDPARKAILQDQYNKMSAPAPAQDDRYAAADALFDQKPDPTPAPAQKPPGVVQGPNGIYGPGPVSLSTIGKVGLNQLTGLGANVIGGFRGLSELVSSKASGNDWKTAFADAGNAATDEIDKRTYQPDQGSGAAKGVEALASNYNPLTWVPKAADWAGGKVTDITGSPEAGAVVNTGINAAAMVLPGTKISKQVASKVVPIRAAERAAPVRVEPTLERPGQLETVTPNTVPAPAAPAANQAAVRAAANDPIRPSDPAAGTFQEAAPVAPEGSSLPSTEQARRAQVLNDIGLSNARKSAITGDMHAASTDVQTAKLDTPAGKHMSQVLGEERAALGNYAENIARDTGGTMGTDQTAAYTRGNAITGALDSLKSWFDDKTSQLYKAADEKAGGQPTSLNGFKEVLGDDSLMTNSDRVHLRDSVNAYMKKLGVVGEDGSFNGTAKQAETVRKYLNEQWSPGNSKFVGALKDALDNDVFQAAGEDIYGQARQMRAQRGATLDNPNGIAKVMDASGPEGINRAVPVEKIADHLATMPVDQLAHIVKTLKEVPPELQPQAQAALAEIKSHHANKILEKGNGQAGQWNAKGVRQYLSQNAARLNQLFTPEEMQRFGTLNDAGNILAKDQSYPGAAVQQHNLLRAGAMHGVQAGATAIGAAVAGPIGASAGGIVGSKLAGKMADAASLKAAKARTVKVSDFLNLGE